MDKNLVIKDVEISQTIDNLISVLAYLLRDKSSIDKIWNSKAGGEGIIYNILFIEGLAIIFRLIDSQKISDKSLYNISKILLHFVDNNELSYRRVYNIL